MSDIAEFLRARLDDDEAYVHQVTHIEPSYPAAWSEIWSGTVEVGDELIVTNDLTLSRFIARHDPARVLREVEAKRRIVELASEARSYQIAADAEFGPSNDPNIEDSILRAVAAVYSDHPDYRQEWSLAATRA